MAEQPQETNTEGRSGTVPGLHLSTAIITLVPSDGSAGTGAKRKRDDMEPSITSKKARVTARPTPTDPVAAARMHDPSMLQRKMLKELKDLKSELKELNGQYKELEKKSEEVKNQMRGAEQNRDYISGKINFIEDKLAKAKQTEK